MYSRLINNIFILGFCLMVSPTLLYAKYDHKRLSCPSREAVRQYAERIEVGQPDVDGTYNAYSHTIFNKENNTGWIVIVNYINAQSDDEAVKLGQKIVQNINTQVNQYPYKIIFYGTTSMFCLYDTSIALFGITGTKATFQQMILDKRAS